MKVVLIGLALVAAALAAKVDFTGHMVISVTPTNEVQLKLLRSMQDTAIDFWKAPTFVNKEVRFRVAPEHYKEMTTTLGSANMPHQIVFSDVSKLIEQEERNIALRRAMKSGKAFDFENYHNLQEIMDFIDQNIVDYPNLVSKRTLATTIESRDVVMTTISSGGTDKPIMFYECGIHAREWISPATCMWIMNELVSKYGSDPLITSYVDTFDWNFILVTNPDGYVFTWGSNRLWRKNRRPSGACVGVDINRNFAAGFGGAGSSASACSETYRGGSAFSEFEAQGIRDYLASVRGRVKAAMSIHSYSQLWLSAFGYKTALPADYSEMARVMALSTTALTDTYGTPYQFGSTSNALYVASGVCSDYYYEYEGVIHSYTVELRDTGRYGFELPPDQILATATETWNGLKVMTDEIIKTL